MIVKKYRPRVRVRGNINSNKSNKLQKNNDKN